MSNLKGSPYRRANEDVEAGGSRLAELDDDDSSSPYGAFDITSTKNASADRLRRWRQAALVLNASRRFRYTLDLKKEEEKKQILRKIRAHAQQIRAAYLFKAGAIAQPETNDAGVDLFHCRINRIGTKSLTLVTKDIQPINRVCYLLKREKFNYKRKNLNFSGTVPSVRTPLKLD